MSDTNPTQAMLEASFQAHEAEARAVSEDQWKRALLGPAEYLKETRDIVAFAHEVWERGPDGAPGLRTTQRKYPRARLDRLSGLLNAFQYASALEVAATHPVAEIGPKSERAQRLIRDLSSALTFLLDDDIEEPADKQLNNLQTKTKESSTRSTTLGQLLLAWGLFSQAERARFADIEGFDTAIIDEAIALGHLLTAATVTATPAERETLTNLRRGFYALAYAEVQALRKAATFVYRDHPKIRQQFFSALERNLRAEQRARRALEQANANAAADAADDSTR